MWNSIFYDGKFVKHKRFSGISYTLRSDGFEQGTQGYTDNATQAQWDSFLWDEVIVNKNVTLGATITEYSDEWWKPYEWIDGGTHNSTQDHFGFGRPDSNCNGQIDNGDGPSPPFPDGFIDDEWLGFMQISQNPMIGGPDIMTPKDVYYSFQSRFACGEAAPYYAGLDSGKSCDGSSACCSDPNQKARNGACGSCKGSKKILQF